VEVSLVKNAQVYNGYKNWRLDHKAYIFIVTSDSGDSSTSWCNDSAMDWMTHGSFPGKRFFFSKHPTSFGVYPASYSVSMREEGGAEGPLCLMPWLTLNLLTSTIVAPPSNARKWQMGFNSAFKGLRMSGVIHLKYINTMWSVSNLSQGH
jgi:hypothetical protein